MIPLLPPLHSDELLYSFLARTHWLNCTGSPKRTLDELFGNRNVRAGIALQSELGALAAHLPPRRRMTAERLALETTLFPYLTAFQPIGVRIWALERLTGGGAGAIHVRLGLVAGVVRLPVTLRYCPACRAEMLAQQGELYWRRAHQLPGLLVCPDHGMALADSHVRPGMVNQHEFIAADVTNCPPDPPPPAWATNREVMKLLGDIARASTSLLTKPPSPWPIEDWGAHYHNALRARGLGRGNARIDQNALQDAYLCHFNAILSMLPEATSGLWLAGMARKHRKSVAPLHHVLLRLLLDYLPVDESPQPFGTGPWPCRNPLAEHFGQPVITECRKHKEGGKTIGVFACGCGYVFARATEPGSRVRILDLGHLFDARLQELLAAGTGLRATARVLAVDPNTVLHHVARLGLPSPWKPRRRRETTPPPDHETIRTRWSTAHRNNPNLSRQQLRTNFPAEYMWLYRYDRDWLNDQPPIATRPTGGGSRHNWPAMDAAIAANLRLGAANLHERIPPVLVSRSALERTIGRPNWLGSRLKKLPLCVAALGTLTEHLEIYQCRRIAWAAQELRARELPLVVWRLRRLAGLPDICAPTVEATLMATAVSAE
jgi:hypothetical protein